jgi:molybdopterin-guanine dinucleotide biosynthesis protein A
VNPVVSAPSTARAIVAGVFVGGAGKRMGGRAKGLLEAPEGGTVLERWLALLQIAGVDQVVLVGRHDAYASLGLETIGDDPPGIGPIGGLAALLERTGRGAALALACDMPYVSRTLVGRLLSSGDAPAAVAPRRNGLWEPLCARYDAERLLPLVRRRIAAGRHALQPLLQEAGAVELPLEPGEANELRDWDTPEDIASAEPLACYGE